MGAIDLQHATHCPDAERKRLGNFAKRLPYTTRPDGTIVCVYATVHEFREGARIIRMPEKFFPYGLAVIIVDKQSRNAVAVGLINRSGVAPAQYANGVPQYNSVHPVAVAVHEGVIDDNVVFLPGAGMGFRNLDAIKLVARIQCKPVQFIAIREDVAAVFVFGGLLGFGIPVRIKVEIAAVVGCFPETLDFAGLSEFVKPTYKNKAFTGRFF